MKRRARGSGKKGARTPAAPTPGSGSKWLQSHEKDEQGRSPRTQKVERRRELDSAKERLTFPGMNSASATASGFAMRMPTHPSLSTAQGCFSGSYTVYPTNASVKEKGPSAQVAWATEFKEQRKHGVEVMKNEVDKKKRRIVEDAVKEKAVAMVAVGGSPLTERDVRRAQRNVQEQVEAHLRDTAEVESGYGLDVIGEGTAADRKKQRQALAQQGEEELKESATLLTDVAGSVFERELQELSERGAITLTAMVDLVGRVVRDELRRGTQDVRETETAAAVKDFFSASGAQREAGRLAGRSSTPRRRTSR